MAQTGDPTGTGTGKSDLPNIPAEFTKTPYKRGSVGMARSQSPDSANSQFFICYDGCGPFTGQYTLFGEVVSGMDVVDKIKKGDAAANGIGHEPRQDREDAARRRREVMGVRRLYRDMSARRTIRVGRAGLASRSLSDRRCRLAQGLQPFDDPDERQRQLEPRVGICRRASAATFGPARTTQRSRGSTRLSDMFRALQRMLARRHGSRDIRARNSRSASPSSATAKFWDSPGSPITAPAGGKYRSA